MDEPELLVLVRHAAPTVEPEEPASAWPLSSEGAAQAELFAADVLSPLAIDRVVTSPEPKARETGEVIARVLGLPVASHDGLREHERSKVPFFERQELFRARVAEALRQPEELVFGDETIAGARDRFGLALEAVRQRHPGQRLAVVAHGTVIASFVAHANGIDPVSFWNSLTMPSEVVVRLPGYRLAG